MVIENCKKIELVVVKLCSKQNVRLFSEHGVHWLKEYPVVISNYRDLHFGIISVCHCCQILQFTNNSLIVRQDRINGVLRLVCNACSKCRGKNPA